MAGLEIKNIKKSYGKTAILKGVNIDVKDGEFISLVGPSGCGKSTLLRAIAGLEHQDSGTISIGGQRIDNLRPSQRNLSMVFQSYALYPHLTIAENISVPLKMRNLSAWQRLPFIGQFMPGARNKIRAIHQKVLDAATTLDLAHLLDRKPGQLSGGQRQRVAVGRALVREPQAFLLDEPLSNLDAKLRVHMRAEISQLHRSLEATFIYVTHDQAEAMTMSDRIAIMMEGELLQVGTPDEVYHQPNDIRVAEFIGSPKINILPLVKFAEGHISLAGNSVPFSVGDTEITKVGLRPEALTITEKPSHLTGKITHFENFGAEVFFHLKLENLDQAILVRGQPALLQTKAVGDDLHLQIAAEQAILFDADGKRSDARFKSINAKAYA